MEKLGSWIFVTKILGMGTVNCQAKLLLQFKAIMSILEWAGYTSQGFVCAFSFIKFRQTAFCTEMPSVKHIYIF